MQRYSEAVAAKAENPNAMEATGSEKPTARVASRRPQGELTPTAMAEWLREGRTIQPT